MGSPGSVRCEATDRESGSRSSEALTPTELRGRAPCPTSDLPRTAGSSTRTLMRLAVRIPFAGVPGDRQLLEGVAHFLHSRRTPVSTPRETEEHTARNVASAPRRREINQLDNDRVQAVPKRGPPGCRPSLRHADIRSEKVTDQTRKLGAGTLSAIRLYT